MNTQSLSRVQVDRQAIGKMARRLRKFLQAGQAGKISSPSAYEAVSQMLYGQAWNVTAAQMAERKAENEEIVREAVADSLLDLPPPFFPPIRERLLCKFGGRKALPHIPSYGAADLIDQHADALPGDLLLDHWVLSTDFMENGGSALRLAARSVAAFHADRRDARIVIMHDRAVEAPRNTVPADAGQPLLLSVMTDFPAKNTYIMARTAENEDSSLFDLMRAQSDAWFGKPAVFIIDGYFLVQAVLNNSHPPEEVERVEKMVFSLFRSAKRRGHTFIIEGIPAEMDRTYEQFGIMQVHSLRLLSKRRFYTIGIEDSPRLYGFDWGAKRVVFPLDDSLAVSLELLVHDITAETVYGISIPMKMGGWRLKMWNTAASSEAGKLVALERSGAIANGTWHGIFDPLNLGRRDGFFREQVLDFMSGYLGTGAGEHENPPDWNLDAKMTPVSIRNGLGLVHLLNVAKAVGYYPRGNSILESPVGGKSPTPLGCLKRRAPSWLIGIDLKPDVEEGGRLHRLFADWLDRLTQERIDLAVIHPLGWTKALAHELV